MLKEQAARWACDTGGSSAADSPALSALINGLIEIHLVFPLEADESNVKQIYNSKMFTIPEYTSSKKLSIHLDVTEFG